MVRNVKLMLAMASLVTLAGCSVATQPLKPSAITEAALADTQLIYASQEKLQGPMLLEEAMARALKYNLDNRLQLMQEAVVNKSFELAKMDMLPILAASAGYFDRNNVDASSSRSVITNQESLEPSTSQDRRRHVADVRFSWNVLDYGVSYLQAKQEADRYLISDKGRRKVMLKLLQQTRVAFWRAVAMQQLSGDIDQLLLQANEVLDSLRRVRQEQLRAPLVTLQDLRELLNLVQQLEQMRQTVKTAEVELATLINVAPGTLIELSYPKQLPKLPDVPKDLAELEVLALTNSTDYATELYNIRIDQLETRKAMLRLLPGIEFSYGLNYDSNSFLVNQSWGEAGIRITWNVLRLLARQQIKDHGEARKQLASARRLAVNMAVVAQVHLAWQEYANTTDRFKRADEVNDIEQNISRLTRHAQQSDAASEVQRISNEVRALRSKTAHMIAYADNQAAFGSLLVSLGLDPVPQEYQVLSVGELSPHLREAFDRWEGGSFPLISLELPDTPVGATELAATRVEKPGLETTADDKVVY